jgi:hypothetical protein
MISPTTSAGPLDRGNDEDLGIDVVRIRLWSTSNSIAVLSDFHSADRTLKNWASNGTPGAVRFEVTYVGDHVQHGSYNFFSKGKRCCTFSQHLRRLMQAAADAESFSQTPNTLGTRIASPIQKMIVCTDMMAAPGDPSGR